MRHWAWFSRILAHKKLLLLLLFHYKRVLLITHNPENISGGGEYVHIPGVFSLVSDSLYKAWSWVLGSVCQTLVLSGKFTVSKVMLLCGSLRTHEYS